MQKMNMLHHKEERLHKQIACYEQVQQCIFDMVGQPEQEVEVFTVESILSSVHQLELDVRTELLHLKLEQRLTGRRICVE